MEMKKVPLEVFRTYKVLPNVWNGSGLPWTHHTISLRPDLVFAFARMYTKYHMWGLLYSERIDLSWVRNFKISSVPGYRLPLCSWESVGALPLLTLEYFLLYAKDGCISESMSPNSWPGVVAHEVTASIKIMLKLLLWTQFFSFLRG